MLLFKRLAFLIFIIFYLTALLASCAQAGSADKNGGVDGTSSPNLDEITPDTVKFADITYSRPDVVTLCAELSKVARAVNGDELEKAELTEAVREAWELYSSYLSMLSYAELMCSKNARDAFYAGEYATLHDSYADIFAAKERLANEILNSEYANELSEVGFGDAIVFRIDNQSAITSEFFTLLQKEEELKREFSLLSENNIYITYDGITDTYRGTLNRLREIFGEGTPPFMHASGECEALYDAAISKKEREIFSELARTRALIADSLGYESYNAYAYDLLGYAHSADEYNKYAEDVFNYLLPIHTDLRHKIFNPYFNNTVPKLLDKATLINNMLKLYNGIDGSIYKTFGGMISSELYDISPKAPNRNESSYTAYFLAQKAPFLFHTSLGDARDYSAIAYGFGNYYDVLINKNAKASPLDSEISARMLEMITVSTLTEALDNENGKYLYYLSMNGIMKELITSSFISLVEHEIYGMSHAEISEETIDAAVRQIADRYQMRASSISDILSLELALKPQFLQCKTMSLLYSSEIFFSKSKASEQLEIYKALLGRGANASAVSMLSGFGIPSPFDDGSVMDLADDIFYSINGYHYYKNNQSTDNVA